MNNGFINEITFAHKEIKLVFHHLTPTQVVENQVQMKRVIIVMILPITNYSF